MPPAATAVTNSIRTGPGGQPVNQQDVARRRAQYAYQSQLQAESMMRMMATLGSMGRGGQRPMGPMPLNGPAKPTLGGLSGPMAPNIGQPPILPNIGQPPGPGLPYDGMGFEPSGLPPRQPPRELPVLGTPLMRRR